VLRLATGGDRQLMMEVIGLAIAGLLPAGYRGAYDDTGTDLSDAQRVMRMLPGQA
jgi:hypothetical protein